MESRSTFHERFPDRERVRSVPVGESKTRQDQAARTDIRRIYARYKKTGVIDHLNHAAPSVGDFSMSTDLLGALTRVEDAQSAFVRLPSSVRKLVDHDPVKLLAMLATEDGRQALGDAGFDPSWTPPSKPPVADLEATPKEHVGAAVPAEPEA